MISLVTSHVGRICRIETRRRKLKQHAKDICRQKCTREYLQRLVILACRDFGTDFIIIIQLSEC